MRPEEMGGMTVLPPFQPMVNCVLAAVVSIGVVTALKKFAPAKAWSIYLGVAVFVFLVELYMPFWAFADMKTILTLELMHVPPTLLIVGGIKKFGFKAAAAAAVPGRVGRALRLFFWSFRLIAGAKRASFPEALADQTNMTPETLLGDQPDSLRMSVDKRAFRGELPRP